jgi:hypothetical protein
MTDEQITAVGGRRSAVGGRWSVVGRQSYDPATGLVTAPANRLGTYVLMTAAMHWNYFPHVGLPYVLRNTSE